MYTPAAPGLAEAGRREPNGKRLLYRGQASSEKRPANDVQYAAFPGYARPVALTFWPRLDEKSLIFKFFLFIVCIIASSADVDFIPFQRR